MQDSGIDRHEVTSRLAIVVGRLNRLIRPGDGFTPSQLSALATIARLGPMRFGDLARLETISAPSATRLMAGLESAGYVTRTADPTDGRAVVLSATETGVAAVLEARRVRAEKLAHLLDGCSDEDIAALATTLDLLERTVSDAAERPR